MECMSDIIFELMCVLLGDDSHFPKLEDTDRWEEVVTTVYKN